MKENRIDAVRTALDSATGAETTFRDWSAPIDLADCSAPPDPGSPGDGPGDWPADFYDPDPGIDPGDGYSDGGGGGGGGGGGDDESCSDHPVEEALRPGVKPNYVPECDDFYGGDDA